MNDDKKSCDSILNGKLDILDYLEVKERFHRKKNNFKEVQEIKEFKKTFN